MTNKETVERNIGLTFDFVKHLIDNPKEIKELPEIFTLEFVEKDFTHKEIRTSHPATTGKSKVVRVRNTFEFSKSA